MDISIIIPIYNSQKHLSKCIESVISQSFKDWELILIDDGSTDDSKRICCQYTSLDTRIKYIYQDNKGVSAARNRGLECAEGRYVAFIDSDDYIDNEYLSSLYTHTNSCEMVACGHEATSKKGISLVKFRYSELKRDSFSEYFTYPHWGFVWGRLFDRMFLIDNGICFDENITFREDNIFIENVLTHANQIKLIDNCLYNYKVCDDSKSTTIKDFSKELYAFDKARIAAEELVKSLNCPGLYKNLNLFGFLYHIILSIYNSNLDKAERLNKLKKIYFKSSDIYPTFNFWKEYTLFMLIKLKFWHIYDFLHQKMLKS